MLILFQILFILFALFAIVTVVKRKQDSYLGPKAMFFWVCFWLVATVVVVWPNSVQIIADHIGIGRGSDLVIYVSVAAIFYLLFRLNIKQEGLRRELTKVVRKRAIEEEVHKV